MGAVNFLRRCSARKMAWAHAAPWAWGRCQGISLWRSKRSSKSRPNEMSDWYEFENAEETPSPALLLYPERIRENVRRMIRMAGDAKRLRPHIKTHKLAEVVKIQLEEGIAKFKCATIAEAELAAAAGAKDILIAYQMVGPNILRLLELTNKFPEVRFSSVVDDEQAIEQLNKVFGDAPRPLEVLLDIDCGQHRTGVEPGSKALKLYQAVATARGLKAD